MDWTIDPALSAIVPGISLGVITCEGVTVAPTPAMLHGRIMTYAEHLRCTLSLETLADIAEIAAWRADLRRLGIDPGKYRPSAEALLRRVLHNKALPSIHGAVDFNNLGSLQSRLPFGLYDRAMLTGPIVYRIGRADERYAALNGRNMSAQGKQVLADAAGPFGSPLTDSVRTSTREGTNAIALTIYFPSAMRDTDPDESRRRQLIADTATYFVRINGGDVVEQRLLV